MKANELRIGNLVRIANPEKVFGGEVITNEFVVSEIGQLVAFGERGKWWRLDEITPIPLTEEWLLKFGFEKQYPKRKTDWYKISIMGNRMLSINANSKAVNIGSEFTGYTNHVHRLQNLYFALTGSELQLK